MKIFAASALTALFLSCVASFAGSESIASSGKEMKQVAPTPVVEECPSWTGFYLGGQAGWAGSDAHVDLDLHGAWDGPVVEDIQDADFLQPIGSHNLNDGDAIRAGGFIGYNYQFGRHFVVGLEGGFDSMSLGDGFGDHHIVSPLSTDIYDFNSHYRTSYFANVSGRIGFAFCRFLPYVTGGVAFSDVDFSQRIFEHFPGNGHTIHFDEHGSSNDTEVGWSVGGGLQYALTNHLSARAEYRYSEFDDINFHDAGVGSVFNGVPSSAFTGNHKLDLHVNSVTVGIAYKF